MIARTAPLMVLIAGAMANKDKIRNISDYATRIAVQTEINEISKLIVIDHIHGQPIPEQAGLADYLKANMKANDRNPSKPRDVARDSWDNEYRIEVNGSRVRIISAGPDRQFGTPDDLSSERDAG